MPRKSRLLVAAALGGTALALSAPATIAAIVDSGPVNIPVPATTAGIYINVVTGVSNVVPASVPGWDINPFGTTGLSFFGATPGASSGYVATGTIASALPPGSVIGPASTFAGGTVTTAATAFRTTALSYVGFRFLNEALGGTVNYGYAQVSTTWGTTGHP